MVQVKNLKHMSSAVDIWNVSENFCAEILNNLNSVKNMLIEHLGQNFITQEI
jgi:hypothetical protein